MKAILLFILLSPCYLFATNRYFSNSGADAAAGTSAGTAWQTIAKYNATNNAMSAGDTAFFKCGDIFYGQMSILRSGTLSNYMVITSYGSGSKPRFYGSEQENLTANWTNLGSNLWRNSNAAFTVDVANLIFNGNSCGTKLMTASPLYTNQGDFWYDFTNDRVTVYSVGNPATFYTDIQCALKKNAVVFNSNQYIKFENLDFRYWGICVWEYSGNFIKWNAIDMHYIGGADQLDDYTGRYGNGLQMWEGTHDVEITNCWINECYDAGISPQGYAGGFNAYNLYIRNNLITNCEYSFEFFERDGTSTAHDIYFEHNTCIGAGRGWAHNQRPDGVNGTHLRLSLFTAVRTNVFIRNNIFYDATERTVLIADLNDLTGITLDYNLYYQLTGNIARKTVATSTNFATLGLWQIYSSIEAHAVSGNPLFFGIGDYRVIAGSPAIATATNVGYGTTIGAYSFIASTINYIRRSRHF